MRVTDKSSQADIQYLIKKKNLNQVIISDSLKVTPSAVSKAIAGNPKVKKLRKEIINLLNNPNFTL